MILPVQVLITPDTIRPTAEGAAGLVSRLLEIQAAHARAAKEIADIKEQLSKLPAGRYPGTNSGEAITVVGETKSLKPNESQVEAARKICGVHADVLFKRTEKVAYKPVESMREIAQVLLKPRRYEQLLALCEVPVEAYVRQ